MFIEEFYDSINYKSWVKEIELSLESKPDKALDSDTIIAPLSTIFI